MDWLRSNTVAGVSCAWRTSEFVDGDVAILDIDPKKTRLRIAIRGKGILVDDHYDAAVSGPLWACWAARSAAAKAEIVHVSRREVEEMTPLAK
jgi:hypothetical protein